MLSLVSVLPVSEIIVMSLLYYPRKVRMDRRTEQPLHCKSTVYIGLVVRDVYRKLCSGSITSTSQDNLSRAFLNL